MTELSRNDKPTPGAEASGMGQLANWLRGLFGARNGENSVRETIGELIEDTSAEAAPINADEGALIANILKLHDLTAEDVMIPRADIIATDQECELEALADLMSREAHSRIPVYHSHLDKVVGFVHIKDVLATMRSSSRLAVRELTREILFAAPSIRVLDLLLEMRAQRTHMAIVVDEFGGVDGLVTIEDLVEEIVGEIEDEHDRDVEPAMVPRADGSFDADARVELALFEAMIGPVLTDEEREEIDTLGGLVFTLTGRVPTRGEVVSHPSGVEFEILDADPRRVKRLRISVTDVSAAGEVTPDDD